MSVGPVVFAPVGNVMGLTIVRGDGATVYGAGGVHDLQGASLVGVGDTLRSAKVKYDPVGTEYGRDDVGHARHASNGFDRELDTAFDIDATVRVDAVHQCFKVDDNDEIGTIRR